MARPIRTDTHAAGPAPARFGRIVALVILALLIAAGALWLTA